jgi:hypothetical protein
MLAETGPIGATVLAPDITPLSLGMKKDLSVASVRLIFAHYFRYCQNPRSLREAKTVGQRSAQ